MKIGIDARALQASYKFGGIGVSSHALVRSLIAESRDHEYTLFFTRGAEWGRMPPRGSYRLRMIRRPFPGSTFSRAADLADLVLGPAEVMGSGVDILHTLMLYKQAWWYPCPSVVTIHDMIPLVYPEQYMKRGWAHRWLYKCAQKRDHVITISEYSKNDIHRLLGIPLERISVTYIAADELFRPVADPAQVEAVSRRYGISRSYFLYVGGFVYSDPRKNLDALFEAFREVAGDGDFDLVLAGKKGEFAAALRRRIDRLGLSDRVIFTGFVEDEDLPALLSGALAFIFPSRYEGFGLPVLEAMACGAPTVAFRATSVPEVAGEDGALLVPPDDPRAIVQALREMIERPDLRAELSQRGMARARSFSWDRTARETLAIYRAVAERAAGERRN